LAELDRLLSGIVMRNDMGWSGEVLGDTSINVRLELRDHLGW